MIQQQDPINVSVARWVEKAKRLAPAALQATATDALARVRELTPVRTGQLRAAWQVVIGGEQLKIDGREGSDDALMARISDLTLGQTIILLNPTVYARRVEYGFTGTDSLGRHFNQAGHFMMTQTIAELPKIAERATQRVLMGRQ